MWTCKCGFKNSWFNVLCEVCGAKKIEDVK